MSWSVLQDESQICGPSDFRFCSSWKLKHPSLSHQQKSKKVQKSNLTKLVWNYCSISLVGCHNDYVFLDPFATDSTCKRLDPNIASPEAPLPNAPHDGVDRSMLRKERPNDGRADTWLKHHGGLVIRFLGIQWQLYFTGYKDQIMGIYG